MMQTDHTELKFIGAAFLRMGEKMWWESEGGQSCGKALSCALEEEEAHGGGRSICDQECQMSVGGLEMASQVLLFWKHLHSSNISETLDPAQEGNKERSFL